MSRFSATMDREPNNRKTIGGYMDDSPQKDLGGHRCSASELYDDLLLISSILLVLMACCRFFDGEVGSSSDLWKQNGE